MKSILALTLCLFALTLAASPVNSWTQATKRDGLYTGVALFSSGSAREISADNDEYPAGYVFPTNAPKYWKKVGADIVAMTPQEQAVVDSATKSNVVADANLSPFEDALLGYLADKFNKDKEALRAEIKDKVNKDKKEKTK